MWFTIASFHPPFTFQALTVRLNGNYNKIEGKNAELSAEKMKLDRAVNEKTGNYRTEKQLRDFLDSLTYDINAAEQDMRKLVNRVSLDSCGFRCLYIDFPGYYERLPEHPDDSQLPA